MKNVLVSIVGPTAVGKTDLTIRLAKEFESSVISADSRQLYRLMNIGTAKPTHAQLDQVPHHFIDYLDPDQAYSAGEFERDAHQLIHKLFSKKSVIIMTGGSGLYLDAVWYGLPDMPEIPAGVREQVTIDLRENGLESLVMELKSRDPEYYIEVDLQNKQRVVRALEICRHTGKPYTWFRSRNVKGLPYNNLKVGLQLPREELYERINARVDKMIEDGLLEEVKGLADLKHCNALQTVGYSELFDYLEGNTSLEEAIELIKRNTRRYAKRQMTWFRRYNDITWFHPEDDEGILAYVKSEL